MNERTTRQQITQYLRDGRGLSPSELAERFDDPTIHEGAIVAHVEHVRRSVGDEERLLVAPPECRDCGFDGFDNPEQNPSRCPDCRSENLSEPLFTIRPVEE